MNANEMREYVQETLLKGQEARARYGMAEPTRAERLANMVLELLDELEEWRIAGGEELEPFRDCEESVHANSVTLTDSWSGWKREELEHEH